MNAKAQKVFGLSAVLLAVIGCGPGPVSVPASYQRWNAKDGTFAIDYPADWEAKGGGKRGVQWANFAKGSSEVRIDVDVSSSLVGEIAKSGVSLAGLDEELGEDAEDLAPVASAHQFNIEKTAADFSGYQEEEAIAFQCGLGDARKSPFTAQGGLSGPLRGYRATALTRDKGVLIVCVCPAAHWEKLRPAFDKMLDSLGPGTGQ